MEKRLTSKFSHLAMGDICEKQNERTTAVMHYQHTEASVLRFSLSDLYQAQQQFAQTLECFEEAHHLVAWMQTHPISPLSNSESRSRI